MTPLYGKVTQYTSLRSMRSDQVMYFSCSNAYVGSHFKSTGTFDCRPCPLVRAHICVQMHVHQTNLELQDDAHDREHACRAHELCVPMSGQAEYSPYTLNSATVVRSLLPPATDCAVNDTALAGKELHEIHLSLYDSDQVAVPTSCSSEKLPSIDIAALASLVFPSVLPCRGVMSTPLVLASISFAKLTLKE